MSSSLALARPLSFGAEDGELEECGVLYVGHFSFIGPESGRELEDIEAGSFTAIVGADSADEAIEKFQDTIEDLRENHEAFDGVETVYFDVGIEVREIPERAVVGYFTKTTGLASRLSTALPGALEDSSVAAFDWGREYEDGEEVAPLMVFED